MRYTQWRYLSWNKKKIEEKFIVIIILLHNGRLPKEVVKSAATHTSYIAENRHSTLYDEMTGVCLTINFMGSIWSSYKVSVCI